ncbi:hypothetical protein JCM10207_003199 [Rhodosporidiobolus poonsookiae]
MVAPKLRSGQSAYPGTFVGPAEDPERYQLLELLHGPTHPLLKEDEDASVWKCKETSTGTLRAVKIFSAACSIGPGPEVVVHRLWAINGHFGYQPKGTPPRLSPHPGGQATSLDVGPYGDAATAFELHGATLAQWQAERPTPSLPLILAKRIICQLLLAIDYIHTGIPDYHFIHGGISLNDVLLDKPFSEQELAEDQPAEALCIKLCGFTYSKGFGGSGGYFPYPDPATAAPEQFMLDDGYTGNGEGPPIDVWAVGVVLSRLLFDQVQPFDKKDVRYENDDPVEEIRAYRLPRNLLIALASINSQEEWPEMFSDETSNNHEASFPFNIPGVEPMPSLRERVETEGKIDDPAELDKLVSFLSACWTLDWSKRPTAKELLHYEWLEGFE